MGDALVRGMLRCALHDSGAEDTLLRSALRRDWCWAARTGVRALQLCMKYHPTLNNYQKNFRYHLSGV